MPKRLIFWKFTDFYFGYIWMKRDKTDKARSIWYSRGGGGAWVFRPGQNIFFSDKIRARLFFSPALRAGLFFFITESYLHSVQAFATTLCLIQAFATTSCFRDNLILKFKAFALYLLSIQVFETTTDCSSRNKHNFIVNLTLFRFSIANFTLTVLYDKPVWTSLTYSCYYIELFLFNNWSS